MSDEKAGAIVLAVCAVLVVAAFLLGMWIGRDQGREEVNAAARERDSMRYYVNSVMQPLWTDYCRYAPHRCMPREEAK